MLQEVQSGVGERDGRVVSVDGVVRAGGEFADEGIGGGEVTGRVRRGPGEHERRHRFVDHYGVGFVDDRNVQDGKHAVGFGRGEPVAEDVVADLADGSIDDIVAIYLAACR